MKRDPHNTRFDQPSPAAHGPLRIVRRDARHAVGLAACLAGALFLGGCAEDEPSHAERNLDKDTAHAHDHDDHDDHDDHAHDDHADHRGEAHADEVTLSADAIARYGVRVAPVRSAVLRPTVVAPARVSFNLEATAHVGCPVRGRVVDLPVRIGDSVARGGPVAVVESPELGEAQADFYQKRVARETAVPAAELARASWQRAAALYEESQGIALGEVQRRESEYRAAQAAIRAAEASAISAENRLHLLGMDQAAVEALAESGEITPHYTVRSAIDGRVIDREITLGELVGPDRESLMIIADTSTHWVLADVPEARLAGIEVGSRAWVNAGIQADQRYEGSVAFVSPLVDPATRSAQVRVEVPASSLPLKPGMFAHVEIEAGQGEPTPVLVVPEESVQTVEGGPAVFVPVEDEPGTFARRAVSVGKAVGGLVPVVSGLSEGEAVVVSGSFILKAELGKGSAEHSH